MDSQNDLDKRLPKVPSQKRSLERYEHILNCAETLLGGCRAEDMSIYDVADAAGLQAQSVYRLFPSVAALNYGLAKRCLDELNEDIAQADYDDCRTWQDAVARSMNAVLKFYKGKPQAMELILGANISREIRNADRENIQYLAGNALSWFEKNDIATFDRSIIQLEIMIDIVDAIWSRSYYLHQEITDEYFQESLRATIAYLGLYMPKYMSSSISRQ